MMYVVGLFSMATASPSSSGANVALTAEHIKEREREREVGWMIDKLTAINEKCKLIHNADSGISLSLSLSLSLWI
jgi:hypothetical protein